MNLRRALRMDGPVRLALVGAGGKTSALFSLAEQIPGRVIVTASTHLSVVQSLRAARHVIVERAEQVRLVIELAVGYKSLLLTSGVSADGRTAGLDEGLLEVARTAAQRYPILIEADGSRRKPLKAPAVHEPAIPGWVDTVVVCAGLSALGRRLDEETVHRAKIFSRLSGLKMGERITPEALCVYLIHAQGGLKSIPRGARRVALLNQADTPDLQAMAKRMAGDLLAQGAYDVVLVASLAVGDPSRQVAAACQPTAGIILAAGGAQRFGQPKVLLAWRGKPLVRHVAEAALQAGLRPVRVVCGIEEADIRRALEGLAVEIVSHPDWRRGQSTSVAAGLADLPGQTGAAVFLLADQPLVGAAALRRLTGRHAEHLEVIVAPRVGGRRANPVLFDRICFAELARLSGDSGGRALFERYPVDWVDLEDDGLLFDVDTPEDYRRLLEMPEGEG